MNCLIVHRSTGASVCLDIADVVKIVTDGTGKMDDAMVTGLQRMTAGEYTYVGNHIVVAVNGGVTTDTLKSR